LFATTYRLTYWVDTGLTAAHEVLTGTFTRAAARSTCWFAAAAHSVDALLAFCAAVEAAATVALVSLQVYAPTLAAGLG
jgi:hypothetical protein